MKKILLIDVDSKIPNLVLMKLSTHYKEYGYKVNLKRLGYNYYPKERDCALINAEGYEGILELNYKYDLVKMDEDMIVVLVNDDKKQFFAERFEKV